MTTIDLCKYVRATGGGWRRSSVALMDFRLGQQVAKEKNIKDLAGEDIILDVPVVFNEAEASFLAGLLRPLIRKQGLDKTILKVTATHKAMRQSLSEFFMEEKMRLKKAEKKKQREAGLGKWSKPMTFLIPDIGTIVRLKEDWTFRLYMEGRNSDLFDFFGIEYGYNGHKMPEPPKVTFKAGTILKVNRIYIRQGGARRKEYSSITFNVQKGKDSVAQANGKMHFFIKKGARFWAKLSDVNKMVVEVDQATLAEN